MKKFICSLFAFFLLSCLTTSANALSTKGARGCGVWVTDRSAGLSRSVGNETWFIGYLSGLAVYSNKDILKDTDNDSLYLWVDNYCRSNPLKDISDAGVDLFFELKKQKGLK